MDFELFKKTLNELDKDSAEKIFNDIVNSKVEDKINQVSVIDASGNNSSSKCSNCVKNKQCDSCYDIFLIKIIDINNEFGFSIYDFDDVLRLKNELSNETSSIWISDDTYMNEDNICYNSDISIKLFTGKEKIKEIKRQLYNIIKDFP